MSGLFDRYRETQSLPVTLTHQEKFERGLKLARLTAEIEKLEAEKKMAADNYKGRIGTLQTDLDTTATTVNQGFENRPVRCRWIMNVPEQGKKCLAREDTGEQIQSADMSQADLQFVLAEMEDTPEEAEGDGLVINFDEKGEFTHVS